MRWLVALVVLLSGCGRFGFTSDVVADAGDDAPGDAGPDGDGAAGHDPHRRDHLQ